MDISFCWQRGLDIILRDYTPILGFNFVKQLFVWRFAYVRYRLPYISQT